MPAYRFYAPADAAQDKIWDDTVRQWCEAQAETYVRGLHAHLQRLCDNRLLWRRLPQGLAVPRDIKREAYFSRYEHHYLFFRALDNGDLGVMSIQHERMDMAVRLREDLATLEAKDSPSN
ncbi:type II toxin-antitoxin system RelE/ParE family toxin [Agrobacterium bohemicum]|uniref:Plasmid stabilization protein n=1 Tax=Agrobacterium bohemicum TaxID=2052828 RepID=A0A135P3V1_9HYPH|nr:type II toxin-antitoxin system RelE/ParE family toxin [Agrobacterium bohemicum]KXG86079.1 plasmid stabilization protein [Agrobacterium bohemicum]